MKDNTTKFPPKMVCISINMEKTGANIKKLIRERGYTIDEIMTITGISTPQAVYKWFSGKSIPGMETMVVLSEVLGKSIREILVIDGDFEPVTDNSCTDPTQPQVK